MNFSVKSYIDLYLSLMHKKITGQLPVIFLCWLNIDKDWHIKLYGIFKGEEELGKPQKNIAKR